MLSTELRFGATKWQKQIPRPPGLVMTATKGPSHQPR